MRAVTSSPSARGGTSSSVALSAATERSSRCACAGSVSAAAAAQRRRRHVTRQLRGAEAEGRHQRGVGLGAEELRELTVDGGAQRGVLGAQREGAVAAG